MILAFDVSAVLCCLFLSLQRNVPFSDDWTERILAASAAAMTVIYLSVFLFSCFGMSFPFIPATTVLATAAALLARRLARAGVHRVPRQEALRLLWFALLGLVFFGLIFGFGSRYAMNNVDPMSHLEGGQRFLETGRIPLDAPFRYPPMTAVLVGLFLGGLQCLPDFLAYQLFNVLVLFGVALAARQIARRMSGRTTLWADLLVVTTTFTTGLMDGLIYGFTSLLVGVFFMLATLLFGAHHRETRSPLSLALAASSVLAVACSYHLFLPIAFVVWYLALPDYDRPCGIRALLGELVRPDAVGRGLTLLALSVFLIFFYVPDHPMGFFEYLSAYRTGLADSMHQMAVPGGSHMDLRFCALTAPFIAIGLVRASRRAQYLACTIPAALLAIGAAYALYLGGRMSPYYFSKMVLLFSSFSIVGLASALVVAQERSRPLAGLVLAVFVGAGLATVLAARFPVFTQASVLARISLRGAWLLSPIYEVNFALLRAEAILSRADLEAALHVRTNAAAILDADTGQLTAAGAGIPLYYYERMHKIPLVFLLLGTPADVYQLYFHGSTTFEQWLAKPTATHLLVLTRDRDTAAILTKAHAAGLQTVFERGDVRIFRK